MEPTVITYYAHLEIEDAYWLIEFPDCPGCQTFGDTKEEALEAAKEALEGWLETTLDCDYTVPKPVATEGEPIVIDGELAARIAKVWILANG